MHYSSGDGPGIVRQRHGKSFRYATTTGRAVRDRATVQRIRSLAIPPAWTRVWISADPHSHLQAIGFDARGRKQYRYHPAWRAKRDEVKYNRLVAFCHALPKIRAAVSHDLAARELGRRKVLATVVALMEQAQLRVGNDEYTRQNGSYGATTLRNHHAKVRGSTLELRYRGKGGIERHITLSDRRLAKIIRACQDLPGQRLFEYVDEAGKVRAIRSQDVNGYLKEISGGPFTAKDYRTWAATMGAALLLSAIEHPGSERACKSCIRSVLETVATRLGHTPAICRSSYVQPRLFEDFTANRLGGTLARQVQRRLRGRITRPGEEIAVDALRAVEPVVARYLDTRRRQHA